MNTERLITTADAQLTNPRTTITDLNVTEVAIFDHVRQIAHAIEGLAAKYQAGSCVILACDIADLLRMQSRIATRRHEMRRALSPNRVTL